MFPIMESRLKKAFLLVLIFFSQSNYSLEVYCFSRKYSLDSIKSYLQTVLAPTDQIFKRESNHCLEIKISERRKELLEKWMYKRYRPLDTYQEGEGEPQLGGGTCLLKVESVGKGQSNTNTVQFGNKNKINSTTIKSSGKKTSSLYLGVGYSGTIGVNGETAELTCRRAGHGQYLVSINLQGLQNSLATTLQVRKGQRINIGSIVEDLSSKKNAMGIPGGVDISKTKGSETRDYFLIAD